MLVRENLAFGLRRRRTPGQMIREKVGGVARVLGLRDLLERRPGQLSGGQRQRVAIGRAMVREPVVYLMDEPLSNLDAKLRVSMRAELARLHDRLGVTTIYVTHDQTEAMTLGDRVCVMLDGRIVQVDTPTRLFQHPADTFVAATIGSPAMNLAVASVEDGAVRFGAHRIGLTRRQRELVRDRTDVVVGLRPSDFRIRPSDFALEDGVPVESVTRLPIEAEVVEQLGAEQMVVFPIAVSRYVIPGTTVQAGTGAAPQEGTDDETLLAEPETTRFTARLDMRHPIRRDQHVDVFFDAERLYLFDPATGIALDPESVADRPAVPIGQAVGEPV
jgi:multiple sugar transport system ATP-binding protein